MGCNVLFLGILFGPLTCQASAREWEYNFHAQTCLSKSIHHSLQIEEDDPKLMSCGFFSFLQYVYVQVGEGWLVYKEHPLDN